MQITESDWKIFRKKIPNWQEAYMERLTKEYIILLQSEKKASDKFWELEKRIKQDKKSPGVIIDMRRSTAINNIVSLVLDEVISLDDLEDFSEDLKEAVKFMVEKW
ncbi:MAG: multidrug transporter [Lachnospiraceae bacterium]|nr:multidrug transporter [Lachnospiraceae bacterium]